MTGVVWACTLDMYRHVYKDGCLPFLPLSTNAAKIKSVATSEWGGSSCGSDQSTVSLIPAPPCWQHQSDINQNYHEIKTWI